MLDMLIRGGIVVTPEEVGERDVGVQDGKIVAVTSPGTLPARRRTRHRRPRQNRPSWRYRATCTHRYSGSRALGRASRGHDPAPGGS